ncbi:interferon gamma [Pelobates cultripes]|uniref:Interferon gamma n=1 Tax=Pelobates cultripes TaxID=61616 RepID=A0AAD1W2F4_PELCU|nr:interferon gamma [Pelobates cultripes]
MRSSTVFIFHMLFALYLNGQISGYSVDIPEARQNVQELRDYYKSLHLDDKSDGSIFTSLLESWKGEEEKKLLLSQVVPMYLKMFDSIEVPKLQKSIKILKHMLSVSNEEVLKQSREKLKLLMELSDIKITDTNIQQRAIRELFPVLQAISRLGKNNHYEDTRKRRQELARRRRGSQS